MTIAVTDVFSNPEPHVSRALKTLGTSKQKWDVFLAIYRGKKKTKSVEDVMQATGLTRKQVLMAGIQLATARLVQQGNGTPVTYSKIDDIVHIRERIIRLRGKPKVASTSQPPVRAQKPTRSRRKFATGRKPQPYKYDVFISHASEDKEPFVRNLASELRDAGISVWYDEFSLKWGDGLRRSIDRGLRESRYGLVVLSPDFFRKDWPQDELEGLFALESGEAPKILPIWHNLDRKQVAEFSPMLAGRLAVSSHLPIAEIIKKLKERLGR